MSNGFFPNNPQFKIWIDFSNKERKFVVLQVGSYFELPDWIKKNLCLR